MRRPDGLLLLVLFLTIDVLIVLTHLSQKLLGDPVQWTFDLGADRSYGEFFMYVKLVWFSIIAALIAWIRRSAVFAALGAAGLILLVEDAFLLHERMGHLLNDPLTRWLPSLGDIGILSLQLGELVWLAAAGLVVLVVFAVGYRRADGRDRADALAIAVFLGLLAVFAVVVDTIHSFFPLWTTGDLVFTVIEDGGELLSLSPVVALGFALLTADTGAGRVGSARRRRREPVADAA